MIKKSRERLIVEALERIFGRTMKAIITDGVIIEWLEPSEVQPSIDQINSIVEEIISEEPMNLLRRERESKLAESDWRLAPDYSSPDQQAWVVYRQALRDLPQQIADGLVPPPALDDFGELLFEEWPLEPK